MPIRIHARLGIPCSHVIQTNIRDQKSVYAMWMRLHDLYAKETTSSKVYWLRKLIGLHMKEGSSINSHVSEFNFIVSQVVRQDLAIDNDKAIVVDSHEIHFGSIGCICFCLLHGRCYF